MSRLDQIKVGDDGIEIYQAWEYVPERYRPHLIWQATTLDSLIKKGRERLSTFDDMFEWSKDSGDPIPEPVTENTGFVCLAHEVLWAWYEVRSEDDWDDAPIDPEDACVVFVKKTIIPW
jgi:hypothetical protein